MGKLMIGNNIVSPVIVNGSPTPSGKYTLLQRISDDNGNEIGTVSGFFTDANNVEYAVVCLDAQYRLEQGSYCSNTDTTITDLPLYSDWTLWSTKETATFNTQKILDFCDAQSATSTACTHCRNKSFTIDGTIYYGQLPNITELIDICKNYVAIQSADISISQYGSLGFPRANVSWSSNQLNSSYSWVVGGIGSVSLESKSTNYFITPVLEIPVGGNMNLSWSYDYIYSAGYSIKVNGETVASSGSSSISETLIGSYAVGSEVKVMFGFGEPINGKIQLYVNNVLIEELTKTGLTKTYTFLLEENTLVRIVYEDFTPGPVEPV